MHRIRIDLSIRMRSKWHCGSGEGGVLVDRLIRRDSRNWPFIPGSTLKGVIRENCEKLSRTLGFPDPLDPHCDNLEENPALFCPLIQVKSPIDAVFGNKYEEGGLIFRDARLDRDVYRGGASFQTRIRLCRGLGTAAEQQLFSSEYAIPLNFKTTIDGYHRDLVCYEAENADDPEFPPYGYCLLIAGICAVERIGGDKSTGSGSVQFEIESVVYNQKSFYKEDIQALLDHEFYDDSYREYMDLTFGES